MSTLLLKIRDLAQSPAAKVFAIFAGGNVIALILNGVGGIVQGRWVDPEVFGAFRKYAILSTYFTIGTSLVHDGLSRQFPYLLGKGDVKRAHHVAAVAQWWYLVATVTFSSFFVILAVVAAVQGNWMDVAGWVTQICVTVSVIYGAYLGVMYRTSSDFKRLSANTVISSTVAFVQLILVKFFGFWGLSLRLSGQSLFGVWLNWKYLPVRVRPRFDWSELKDLMLMSVRFSIPGYLDTSALSATFTSVLLFSCGQEAVGIFGFALALRGMIMTFNNSISQIFNVKVNVRFGKDDDFRASFRYTLLPTALATGLSAVLCVVAIIAMDPFVRWVLPKYVAALPVLDVLLCGMVVTSMQLPLALSRAALMYKTVYIQCGALTGSAAVLLLLMPHDPVSMAWIQVLSSACYTIAGYSCLIRRYVKEWRGVR